MSSTPEGRRPPKNERRDAARERARREREEQERKRRRRRLFVQGGIIVAVVAIAVVIAVVIVTSIQPAGPGPKNMADNSATITKGDVLTRTPALKSGANPTTVIGNTPAKGVLVIRAYEDFMCPYCGNFESANGPYIASLVKSGKAVLKIYPVSILDRSSQGTQYSTRAANAAACVANFAPDAFFDFHRLLYAHQPAEDSAGLTNAQLLSYAKQAGVSLAQQTDVASCVNGKRYFSWVTAATNNFLAGRLTDSDVTTVTGTPVVLVNGKQYGGAATGTNADFLAFLATVTG